MRRYAEHLAPGTLTIYLLHGVIERPTTGVRNYTLKHLPLALFRELCGVLGAAGTPVAPDEAVAMLRGEDELPDRAFLLTFDDGFRNNLTLAAPVMQERGIGAAFYVTSGFVEHNDASWIDRIEDAVESTDRPALRLPWSGEAWPSRTREERIALLDEIRRVVKTDDRLDPYEVADALRAEAAAGDFEPHPELDQKLTWDEVRELAQADGFAVGGHSHTHRILSHLPPGELERELDTSIAMVRDAIGAPVRHYSYPEGLEHCYSDAVIEALKARGVVCSPTAEPGANRVGDDLFRLRRIMVPPPGSRTA